MARDERRTQELLAALVEGYGGHLERLKRERSGLDFEDLELITRDLLKDNEGIRLSYAERFDHVLVDEFQDVNPLQNELLAQLDRGNLFRVGDERQSIYGFRNADVDVFTGHHADADAEGRAQSVTVNFRSRREVLDGIDLAFSRLWGEEFEPLQRRPQRRCRRPSRASSCWSPTARSAAGTRASARTTRRPSAARCARPRRGARPRRACWRGGWRRWRARAATAGATSWCCCAPPRT